MEKTIIFLNAKGSITWIVMWISAMSSRDDGIGQCRTDQIVTQDFLCHSL